MRSRRFRRLPTDTHRLLFLYMLLTADPFGNFELDPENVGAMLARYDMPDDDYRALVDHLIAADLIRPYTAGDKQLAHIPRYRQRLKYENGKIPRPPQAIEDPWIAEAINNKDLRGKDRMQPGAIPNADSQHPAPSTPTRARALSPDHPVTSAPRSEVKRSDLKRSEVKLQSDSERAREDAPAADVAALAKALADKYRQGKTETETPASTAAAVVADAPPKTTQSSSSWWSSQAGIEAKALELAMPANPGERWPDWVSRLRQADAERGRKPRKSGTAAHQAPPAT
jgi:hypothetical protein